MMTYWANFHTSIILLGNLSIGGDLAYFYEVFDMVIINEIICLHVERTILEDGKCGNCIFETKG